MPIRDSKLINYSSAYFDLQVYIRLGLGLGCWLIALQHFNENYFRSGNFNVNNR